MKNLIFLSSIIFMVCTGCEGQKKPDKANAENKSAADSLNKPQTEIRVNRQYDDKGNLIQYDSSYSYYYMSPGMKNLSISSDSLFRNFMIPFRHDFDNLFNDNMNRIFFNDSLFKYDFYNSDYFSRRFQLNMRRFENMFRNLDSLKGDWLRQNYPEGGLKKQ